MALHRGKFEECRTINQEHVFPFLLYRCRHGVFHQLDGHLQGNDDAFLDTVLDHLAELRSWPILLLSQQIAG